MISVIIVQICEILSANSFAYLAEVKSCQQEIRKSFIFAVCLDWVKFFVLPVKCRGKYLSSFP